MRLVGAIDSQIDHFLWEYEGEFKKGLEEFIDLIDTLQADYWEIWIVDKEGRNREIDLKASYEAGRPIYL